MRGKNTQKNHFPNLNNNFNATNNKYDEAKQPRTNKNSLSHSQSKKLAKKKAENACTFQESEEDFLENNDWMAKNKDTLKLSMI